MIATTTKSSEIKFLAEFARLPKNTEKKTAKFLTGGLPRTSAMTKKTYSNITFLNKISIILTEKDYERLSLSYCLLSPKICERKIQQQPCHRWFDDDQSLMGSLGHGQCYCSLYERYKRFFDSSYSGLIITVPPLAIFLERREKLFIKRDSLAV